MATFAGEASAVVSGVSLSPLPVLMRAAVL